MADKLKEYRRKLEAAREETAALRREEERRQDYLVTLVHEFRNPLTALGGAVEILEDSLEGRLGPKEREFFDVIDVSLGRLGQMLDEMLELTSLEGREVELKYEKTNVGALARNVCEEFEPLAKISGVKINPVEIRDDVPEAECDPELITRAIANLVSNAVKYNQPGGEVTVTVSEEEEEEEEEENLRLAVADTGVGIPPEDVERVFRRFYRAPQARRDKITGTGLGLTIAKNIVELHGGEISFTSRAGEGSTFWFSLPLTGSREGGR